MSFELNKNKAKDRPPKKRETAQQSRSTKHDPSKTEAKGSTPVMQMQTPVPQERGKGSMQPGQEQTKGSETT